MRIGLALLGCLALVACAPPPPDNTQVRGVGFGDNAEMPQVVADGLPVLTGPFVVEQRISEEGGATFESNAAQPAVPVRVDTNNPGISDEQDFAAVASRESIESDAARLEAQRNAYQQVQPGLLPQRSGSSNGATIVEFALSTTHPIGQNVYGRSSLSGQNRFERNCAKYTSQDQAQAAFLAAGGPERDRLGIDPDGDGYACYWDPAPFRAAIGR